MPYAKPGVTYPIRAHVYGIHVRPDWGPDWAGFSMNILYADTLINGRKLELGCATGVPEKPYKEAVPLTFGDFQARLLKGGSGLGLGDGYELLLPNKRVLGCTVAGMTE